MIKSNVVVIDSHSLFSRLKREGWIDWRLKLQAIYIRLQAYERNLKEKERLDKEGCKCYFLSIPSEKYALYMVVIQKWMKENDASFYAEEKQHFSIWSAIDKAEEEGRKEDRNNRESFIAPSGALL